MSVAEIIKRMVDLSPEVSKALWDFLRFCNPGVDIIAYHPDSQDPYPEAQAKLNEFIQQLQKFYGSLDVIFNRIFLGAFIRGAFTAELVLDASGRTPIDIATPAPASFRYRKIGDPARGQIWVMGQYQDGAWVQFDRETIKYIPIDPLPNVPYGRPVCSIAVFSGLFLLSMIHDLKRVVQQQGYPRIDIAIKIEELKKWMPASLEQSPDEAAKWVEAA